MFSSVQFVDLATEVSARLGDSSRVFWVAAEVNQYLIDALRTYNAITGFWRERKLLPVVASQDFYDLPTLYPAECGFAVTNSDLVTFIEYQLIEPATPLAWTGTAQFTLESVMAAIQGRRDSFQLEAGMVQSARTLPISPVPQTRTVLPDEIIDLRHVHWLGLNTLRSALVRDDQWSADLFRDLWQTDLEQAPCAYSVAIVPPLWVEVMPAPTDGGMLRVLSVENGATLPVGAAVPIGLPDDWCWVTRFGALSDLLSQEGIANDVQRSQYCERRWAEGVALAKMAQCALTVTLSTGANLPVQPLAALESFGVDQLLMPGRPEMTVVSGYTTIMLAPIADVGNYSAVIDLVRKMPVDTGDYVQLPSSVLDAIVDYAVHLASFKQGGQEFARTMPLLEQFYAACGVTMDHFRAMIPNYDALAGLAKADEQIVPRAIEKG